MNKYWQYVKKRPALFISAAVVFGLLLFVVTRSGGGAASGGGTVISQGPSEALQAQDMAINASLASAQISANTELQRGAMELEALSRQIEGQENLAVLAMRGMIAELDTNRAISSEQTQASLAALNAQLSYGLAGQESANQASVDMARIAADAGTQQLAINAAMQRDIVNRTLEANITQTALQTSLQRDQAAMQTNLQISLSNTQAELARDQMAMQTAAFLSANETAFKQSALATIPQLKGSTGARVLTEIVNSPRTNFAQGFTQTPNGAPPAFMLAPPSNPAVMI